MVLDHDDDRALVDGEEGVGVPVSALAERIDEAELAPERFPCRVKKWRSTRHDLCGRIGQARERGGRA